MSLLINSDIYYILLLSWCALALVAFVLLFFISAPYGKLNRKGWGFQIESRLAWIFMEVIALLGFIAFFILGKNRSPSHFIFLMLWLIHYSYRSLIFPFLKNPGSSPMPVFIMLFGIFFNIGNSFFNGYYLFFMESVYDFKWLLDIRLWLGALVFLLGLFINIQADLILRNLRKTNETSYKIPYGGFFRFVSCPNYLGEILEWAGWAIATWSLAGFSFLLWTVANLAPRARSYHLWYHKTFAEYPPERKALIPFLF